MIYLLTSHRWTVCVVPNDASIAFFPADRNICVSFLKLLENFFMLLDTISA